MVVPEYAVTDKTLLVQLNNVQDSTIMPEDKTVFAAVSVGNISPQLRKYLVPVSCIADDEKTKFEFLDKQFVPIILEESLRLQLRGTKMGRLKQVRCIIPALGNVQAASLNHAYRLISEQYEPHRKSNTGNVFLKMIFIDEIGKCHLLNELRRRHNDAYWHNLSETPKQV